MFGASIRKSSEFSPQMSDKTYEEFVSISQKDEYAFEMMDEMIKSLLEFSEKKATSKTGNKMFVLFKSEYGFGNKKIENFFETTKWEPDTMEEQYLLNSLRIFGAGIYQDYNPEDILKKYGKKFSENPKIAIPFFINEIVSRYFSTYDSVDENINNFGRNNMVSAAEILTIYSQTLLEYLNSREKFCSSKKGLMHFYELMFNVDSKEVNDWVKSKINEMIHDYTPEEFLVKMYDNRYGQLPKITDFLRKDSTRN